MYGEKSCTAENTVILPNFLVWKFCGKAEFPHSFGQFARNYAETVPFHKISTPGNQVKLRYFSWCYEYKQRLHLVLNFSNTIYFFKLQTEKLLAWCFSLEMYSETIKTYKIVKSFLREWLPAERIFAKKLYFTCFTGF